MSRCLQLAKNGLPEAMPNPAVGAVLVADGRIIGEGYTSAYGGPHAEVNAIAAVKNEKQFKNATLYVSLEPCSHYGKTPPCSNLIIAKGIKHIVVGTMDPYAKVAGRGIQKLTEAGCDVTVGVLEKECHEINKRFFCMHQKKRPYIILKWAQTGNGFIAPSFTERQQRRPVWITNGYSRQRVHKWRTEEAAILVGTTTAVEDNPVLNARRWHGKSPVRVVIDRQAKIHTSSAIFNDAAPTFVLTEQPKADHANIRYFKMDFSRDLPRQICELLYTENIPSLIIEGGAVTLQNFIKDKLWDEARIFIGKTHFHTGVKAPKLNGEIIKAQPLLEDRLEVWKPIKL